MRAGAHACECVHVHSRLRVRDLAASTPCVSNYSHGTQGGSKQRQQQRSPAPALCVLRHRSGHEVHLWPLSLGGVRPDQVWARGVEWGQVGICSCAGSSLG